jgi:hypothetical protein
MLFHWLSKLFRSKAEREQHSLEDVFKAGNLGDQPSAEYLQRLDMLDNVVRECIFVSRSYGGIPAPTRKHFYASVLFTSLLSRATSLVILAPHSPWANKLIEHWDYASLAVIARTMIELRCAFHYLCIDQCSDDEWECRWNLLNLHDCISRKRLFEAREVDAEQSAGFDAQAEELRDRLKANAYFAQLKNQQKLLNGQAAYLYPIEDLAEKAGIEKKMYRFLNVFFSSHVHGLPMSYYRMGGEYGDRGRGVPSPIEEGYTSMELSLAATLLVTTRDEVHSLFNGLVKQT